MRADKFTTTMQEALGDAQSLAVTRDNPYIEPVHVLAAMLAQADGIDDKFTEAMATGKETFVKLNKEIPVRLMYHTAYLGTEGRLHFVADAYGWDNDVATALGYPSKGPAQFKPQAADVGP